MINRQLRPDQHRIGRVPVPGVPLTAENAVIENTAGDRLHAFPDFSCSKFLYNNIYKAGSLKLTLINFLNYIITIFTV